MNYRVEHRTEYRYSSPAALSYNDVCLGLRQVGNQTLSSQDWEFSPQPDYQKSRIDFFGNEWRLLTFEHPLSFIRLKAFHEVEVRSRFPGGLPESPGWETCVQTGHQINGFETAPFRWNSPFIRLSPAYKEFGLASFASGTPLLRAVYDLVLAVYRDFEYSPESTTVATPLEDVARTRKGVCQDFAHYTLAVLRSLGLAARYVSGYLNTLPPPGKEKLVGADASHAWISVFCPWNGWVDFDPTNGLLVQDQHITLAWGRDYGDVAPLKGVVMGGGAQKLKVEVDVTPLTLL